MKGSYILELHILKDIDIEIGSLGLITFKKGDYLYIGSAMGETGSSTLINRVKRHLKPSHLKKIHWHIDYLLEDGNVVLYKIYLIPCSFKLECIIAQELLNISDDYVNKFGSSDCRCKSHLVYFKSFTGFS